MLLLLMLACTRSAGPDVADEPLPPAWWWVTAPDLGFEAAFPGVPKRGEGTEDLDLGQGVVRLPAERYQLVSGTSAFTVSVVDVPDGTLDVGRVLEARATALGAELADRGRWRVGGLERGEQATLKTGRPGQSVLRVGSDGDDLWIVQAVGDRDGPASRFASSFARSEPEVTPTPVGSGTVGCPARCGATSDRIELAGGLEPLTGVRGILGTDRFEVTALRVPAGVKPAAALEALEERAVRRSRGAVTSESDEGGRRLVVATGDGRTWMRFVASGEHAYALEVTASSGHEPEWSASFLDSLVP